MVEPTDRPPIIAHIDAPLPRWATTTRPSCRSGAVFCHVIRYVFIAEPVKAIASNTFVVILARQGENVVLPRVIAVKGRIETGNLNRVWKTFHRRPGPGQIVRLMQRRKRRQLVQRLNGSLGQRHRCVNVRSTVDNTMPYRSYVAVRKRAGQQVQNPVPGPRRDH